MQAGSRARTLGAFLRGVPRPAGQGPVAVKRSWREHPRVVADRGLAILVLVGIAGLALATIELIPHAEGANARLACALQIVMTSGLGALAWRIRSTDLGPAARRAWSLVGLAAALTAGGDLVALLSGSIGRSPAPLHIALYTTSSLVMLGGLFTFPLAARTRQDWATAILDGSIVVLGGLIATWVTLFLPGTRAGLTPAELLLGSLGPLGGLAGLVGLARLAVNPHRDSHPLPMVLLVIGLLGFVIASLGGACAASLGQGWVVEPAVFNALGTALLAVAAHLHFRLPPARAELHRERYTPLLVHARALLPYAAVGAGFWFPLDAANSGRIDQFSDLVLSAAALTAIVVVRQITVLEHRRRVAVDLRSSEGRLRELLETVPTVVYTSDYGPDGAWRYVSPRVEELLGYSAQEWTADPKLWWERVHPDDRERVAIEEAESWQMADGERVAVEYRMLTRDGRARWVSDEAAVVRPADGSRPYWSGFLSDITDRRSLEEQLQQQAFQDPLTGLANRAVFADRVDHALARTRGFPAPLAVLFLDLDNFKTVNDGMGHAAGDALLTAVGARLLTCLRPGDTAARLGGDEFAVLLEDTADDAPLLVAQRIHEALSRPVLVVGREIVISASIGVARAAARPERAADLLRNADAAMYVAKRTGKSRTQVFEPTMHAAAVRRLELNQDMRRAAEVEEFIVHYQPLVRLRDEAVVGLEALIRWDHPRRGVVAPADFIALAEETGQIVKIGRMVLERACQDLRRWQQTVPGGAGLSVSVNVSARQLIDDSFVDSVAAALGAASLDPSSLVLEITESVVMSDIDGAIERLHAVKALGVRLAIDDFGTGYSSLGYLRRLPVDVLKVDRSLIAGVDEDGQALALAEMIVHLGRTLRLETVAEGVERLPQAIALRRIGFDVAQGYHYSRPIPAEGVGPVLATMGRSAAAEGRPGSRRLAAAT